jgi:hypothetical protein
MLMHVLGMTVLASKALAVVAGETRLAAADSATSLMHFLVVAVSDNRLVHHADKI